MGIRLRESTSGKELVGTVDGQTLVWNNTTQRWDVGSAAGLSPVGLSAENVAVTDDGALHSVVGPLATVDAPSVAQAVLLIQSSDPAKGPTGIAKIVGPSGPGPAVPFGPLGPTGAAGDTVSLPLSLGESLSAGDWSAQVEVDSASGAVNVEVATLTVSPK